MEKKSASVAAAAGQDPKTQEKFALYTEAFNQLVDDFSGIGPSYEAYVALDIPAADASGNLFFTPHVMPLEQALAKLKQGRAVSAGQSAAEADGAVDTLVTRGETLLVQWKALAPYYDSKAYRDDGLAKGKAGHAALMTAYEATLSGIEELDTALTAHLRARDTARIAAYREKGDTFAYTLMNTMQQADLFSSAVIEGDTAEADRLLPLLAAANADLHEVTAEVPPGQTYNKVAAPLIASTLDRMIGSYRDFKRSGDDNHRSAVVDTYNTAVDLMNDVQFAS